MVMPAELLFHGALMARFISEDNVQKVRTALNKDLDSKNAIIGASLNMKKDILHKVASSVNVKLSDGEVTTLLADITAIEAIEKTTAAAAAAIVSKL